MKPWHRFRSHRAESTEDRSERRGFLSRLRGGRAPSPASPDNLISNFGPEPAAAIAIFQSPRRVALLLGAGFVAAALIVFTAATALAGIGQKSEFGTSGTGNGQFATSAGVAVKQSSGNVYVVDQGNARVQVFDSDGNFQSQFGSGDLSTPEGIAVSQSTGDIYVTDSGTSEVVKFNSGGAFQTRWGGFADLTSADNIDVDPSSGDVYVAEAVGGQGIKIFGPSGASKGIVQFTNFFPWTGVELDSTGDIYATTDQGRNAGVWKMGGFPNQRTRGGAPQAIAFDQFDAPWVLEASPEAAVVQYDSSFNEQLRMGVGEFSTAAGTRNSLALGNSAATLYASDGANDRVLTFGEVPPSPPIVGGESANVLGGAAELNAEVNPRSSEITTCRFEYVDDAEHAANGYANALSVPCENPPAGTPATPQPVSAQIAPLTELTTYHWRIFAENAEGQDTGADQTFTTPDLPFVQVDDVTGITASDATFEGTVNPEGNPVTTQFEYSPDGFVTSSLSPVPPEDVGSGTSNVQVTTSVDDLIPDADFEVRLLAHSPAVGGTAFSAPVAFTTPPIPPTFEGYAPSTAGKESARLGAMIHPHNAETDYFFEYGTDASYGSSSPVDTIADDTNRPYLASSRITGLPRETTIHYRVVAENAAGRITGPDRTVSTYTGLPNDMAYEMVTPPDKDNFSAGGFPASADGNRLFWGSKGAIGDVTTGPESSAYLSQRTADGWTFDNISTEASVVADATKNQNRWMALNEDLTIGTTTGFSLTPDSPAGVPNVYRQRIPDGEYTLLTPNRPTTFFGGEIIRDINIQYTPQTAGHNEDYTRIFLVGNRNVALIERSGEGVYEWVEGEGLRPVHILPDRYQGYRMGGTGGTYTLSFDGETTAPLAHNSSSNDVELALEALPNLDPADVGVTGGFNRFSDTGNYVVTFGERFVNTTTPELGADGSGLTGTDTFARAEHGLYPLTGGTISPFVPRTTFGTDAPFTSSSFFDRKANFSEDGTRAVWSVKDTNEPQSNQIFLRDTGTTPHRTLEVTHPQGGPDANGEERAEYFVGDDDLSTLFFTSESELTPDANTGTCRRRGCDGNDLYRYEVDTDTLTNLVPVATGAGARVLGVLGASEDASRVYFAAESALTPEATPGEGNVYLWSDDGSAKGAIEYVATVGTGFPDQLLWRPRGDGDQVTPDGRFLAFHARAAVTSYDKEGPCGPRGALGPCSEVYLFDAETGPNDPDRLRCVSCNPRPSDDADGRRNPLGNATVPGRAGDVMEPRALLDDGSKLYFTTEDALVEGDKNAAGKDVYEYDIGTGELSMISPGRVPGSRFADASVDGSSVFFNTDARLLGIDTDAAGDVYVARTGGGFSNPPETPCQGDECQGDPTDSPDEEAIGSTTADGSNVDAEAQRCERLANRFQALKERFLRLRLAFHRADDPALKRRIARRARRVKQRAIQVRQAARECRGNL